MRRMRSSCTDVISARNSLSKNCSELRHPAKTTRISSHHPAPVIHLKTTLQVGSGPLLDVPPLYIGTALHGVR